MTLDLLTPQNNSCTEPLQAFTSPDRSEEHDTESFQWDALEVVSGDRSLPASVQFSWQDPAEHSVYDLYLSTTRTFDDPLIHRELSEPSCQVINLHIGTRYFWKVIARNQDTVSAESDVWSFTTHPSTPRWVHVPGITNVRDLGGWPLPGGKRIRQGRIYRSSELNNHVNVTDEGRRVLIEDLRIRTDLDLRGAGENDIASAVLDPSKVTWVNIPINPYTGMADPAWQEGYRQIFSLFADPAAHPVLFHCWGGCDRVGTVAFLLKALLGAEQDQLFTDYALSSFSVWGKRDPSGELFQALLECLASYGGEGEYKKQVESFLLSIGVTAEEIDAIRTHLTDNV